MSRFYASSIFRFLHLNMASTYADAIDNATLPVIAEDNHPNDMSMIDHESMNILDSRQTVVKFNLKLAGLISEIRK